MGTARFEKDNSPTVIPASVAYIKVVAVKKLVVELRVGLNSRSKDCL